MTRTQDYKFFHGWVLELRNSLNAWKIHTYKTPMQLWNINQNQLFNAVILTHKKCLICLLNHSKPMFMLCHRIKLLSSNTIIFNNNNSYFINYLNKVTTICHLLTPLPLPLPPPPPAFTSLIHHLFHLLPPPPSSTSILLAPPLLSTFSLRLPFKPLTVRITVTVRLEA